MELPSAYVIRLMFNSLVLLGLILCADYGRRQMLQLSEHRAMLYPTSDYESSEEEAACQLSMMRLIASLKAQHGEASGWVLYNQTEDQSSALLRETLGELNQTQICDLYTSESHMKRSSIINIFQRTTSVDDVTLVTQVSLERMDRLAKTAQYWEGPMSVTVYLQPSDVWSLLLGRVCGDERMRTRENLLLHLSFVKGMFYPVNYLRNVALNASQTDYVYLTDADMIPSPRMYSQIKEVYLSKGRPRPNESLVVPAFGANHIHQIEDLPSIDTKEDLIKLWKANVVEPFLTKKKVEAHRATNFKRWQVARWPYQVAYEQDFEPYVVMRRRDVPPYHERFVGRNRNKLSHLEEVARRGIKFMVAPELYTVHVNHTGRESENHDANKYLRCTMAEYRIFKSEHLNKTVGASQWNTRS